jgi:hypothetical protein
VSYQLQALQWFRLHFSHHLPINSLLLSINL